MNMYKEMENHIYTDEELIWIARMGEGDTYKIEAFEYKCPYCYHVWWCKNENFGKPIDVSLEVIEEIREEYQGSWRMGSQPVGEKQNITCPECNKEFDFYPFLQGSGRGNIYGHDELKEGYTTIREYAEKDSVFIEEREEDNNRLVIVATNEGGCNSTSVDLEDVIKWVRENMPELLERK